jgi:tetratricopeptide (TPR) repeat protein
LFRPLRRRLAPIGRKNRAKVIDRTALAMSIPTMTSWVTRGIRCGLLLLGTGMIMSAPGLAQPRMTPAAQSYSRAPAQANSGYELRGYLRALAANPNSLEALIGAGRSALASGDAEASLSFYGRADQISPRNARAKAGMAAALAHLGQPQTSISLFAQAVALGAPEGEIADDRGLAFDMAGDPSRAQRDYAVAMRYRDEPALRRRMALSLAISGQREAALRLIDAQLRRNDRAAWRTQAFVLALTGDYAGANLTAQLMMPAGTAQAMAPFFARLPALSAAQKARAVHLGQFPNGGVLSAAGPARAAPADPGALAMAMSGSSGPVAARTGPRVAAAARADAQSPRSTPRRRPDTIIDSSDPYNLRNRSAAVPRQQTPAPQSATSRQPTALQPQSQPPPAVVARWTDTAAASEPAPSLNIQPRPPPITQPLYSPPAQIGSSTAIQSPSPPAPQPSATTSAQPGSIEPLSPSIQMASAESAEAQPSTPAQAMPIRSTLADIAAVINALPLEPHAASTRAPEASFVAHPSRHWVQIAGAANRAGLPAEFARLRGLAPDELARRSAYTTPLRFTNRLLVGPFDSDREAQAFVNQLAARNVAAFAWTSPAGQEIERLQ